MKSLTGSSEVGILTLESFVPVFSLPFLPSRASFDASLSSIIIEKQNREISLISLYGTKSIHFPLKETPDIIISEPTWKVRTADGVSTYEGDTWQKNPRYTDYLDIDARYRIGYIDRSDTERQALANIASPTSLFFLLDRETGISSIILKGRDIR